MIHNFYTQANTKEGCDYKTPPPSCIESINWSIFSPPYMLINSKDTLTTYLPCKENNSGWSVNFLYLPKRKTGGIILNQRIIEILDQERPSSIESPNWLVINPVNWGKQECMEESLIIGNFAIIEVSLNFYMPLPSPPTISKWLINQDTFVPCNSIS